MPDTLLEPTLDWDDIQGNVLAGFNKDHQTLLAFSFGSDLSKSKEFVQRLADVTSSLRAVVSHKADRATRRQQTGRDTSDSSVWTAVSFSFQGLLLLRSDANDFTDTAFRRGMLGSATSTLGDPVDVTAPGNPNNWIVGAPGKVPDALVIVAADRLEPLADQVMVLKSEGVDHGLALLYEETGHNLNHFTDPGEDAPSGHEHFGFKDGISQPGVRGTLPSGRELTPRRLQPDPADTGPEYAQQGQPLVCTGQFVLGYATQQAAFARQPGPPRALVGSPGAIAPLWAENGSFLVFRRLRQLVGAFREFTVSASTALSRPGVDGPRVAAMLVGRWPSGAPIIRTPTRDDPTDAEPRVRNAFAYGSDNAGLDLPDDTDAVLCPAAGHVRKVNPRDLDTDQGEASATLRRRILRRGIPYGPLFRGLEATDSVDRGLLFLCYQSSIRDQFEFLTSNWINDPVLPTDPSNRPGYDMLIGQTRSRERSACLRFRTNGRLTDETISNTTLGTKDWVVPTGGGYFFAPSISAMRDKLAKTN